MSLIEEQEKALQAKLSSLDGPDWDSEDDDGLQKSAEEDAALAKTKKGKAAGKHGKKGRNKPGTVLYLGHLPPNFEEQEIWKFLQQFGKVLHVRLARSKKTGGGKGYGFVEMQRPDVANIVADTLSGYILFGQKRLVCHVIPPEKVHRRLFFAHAPRAKKEVSRVLALEKIKDITTRLISRERKKRETLKELGIDYDFPGYEASANQVTSKETEKLDAMAAERNKNARKESVESIGSEGAKSTKTNRVDSVACENSESAQLKRRKELTDDVDRSGSKFAKKTRKDSIASVESTGSKTKKDRRRKHSDGSVNDVNVDIVSPPDKSPKRSTRNKPAKAVAEADPKKLVVQSEKKPKQKLNKRRRST